MKQSDLPLRIQLPFGSSAGAGFIRQVPVASQIGITDGAASFTDGFPPLNFLPVGAGGVPPFGQDFNGLLNQMSAWNRWQATGGPPVFDQTFATAIGGYPKGAVLSNASTVGQFWISTADDNAGDPGNGAPNWIAFPGYFARQRLTVPSTIYVNPSTGNDAYNGQSATVQGNGVGPFATLNRAYSYAQALDLGGQVLTVSCAGGSYAPFIGSGPVVGQSAAANILFTATGAASITQTSASGFCVTMSGNAWCGVSGPWTFSAPNASSAGGCMSVQTGAQLYIGSGGITFGAAGLGNHISSQVSGIVLLGGSYTIQNISAARHIFASQGSVYSSGAGTTITLQGTPAFSAAFCEVQGGIGYAGFQAISFVGSAVGIRYSISQYGWINSYGGGQNFLPGNAAGVILAGSYT